MFSRMHTLYKQFRDRQQGSVAIIVGLAVFVLVIGAGAAVDMARAQILQTKIQSALDTAGLAALASLSTTPSNSTPTAWAQAQAQRYFDVNFPAGYLGTDPIQLNTVVDTVANTATLTANTTQATSMMKMVGINSVNVSATSKVTAASQGVGMELVLVLDNTGSMNCNVVFSAAPCNGGANSKIAALRSAANKLLDILYGAGNETAPDLYVGIVPFSQAVNIGQQHKDWLDVYYNPNTDEYYNSGDDAISAYDWGPGGTWGGCVQTQKCWGGWAAADYPPFGCGFEPYWYPPEAATTQADGDALVALNGYYWNGNPQPPASTSPIWRITGWRDDSVNPSTYLSPLNTTTKGPNLGCPQPITQMTAFKSNIVAAINSMVATGDTIIPEGVVWGHRMLSPDWRPYWGGEMATNNLPLDYNSTNSRKVAIIMSDGWNHFLPYNFTAYGFVWDAITNIFNAYYGHSPNVTLNEITDQICSQMKSKGIIIYTIGFGKDGAEGDPSSVNVDLLRSCASDNDHFFLAPTNAQLEAAFQKIGQALSNLRVSQ